MNAKSILGRLKNIATLEKRPLNELLLLLKFERFLARVASSPYSDKLIFKGGLCLHQYIDNQRHTKDLDFLLKKIDASKNEVEEIFVEIAAIDLGDHFSFTFKSVSILEDHNKMYPGYRVKMEASLGSTKSPVQIDIGIGDSVVESTIELKKMTYKGEDLVGSTSIELECYPREFIFSEKFQTAVARGHLNSRMKDYFDLISLIRSGELDKKETKKAIQTTFRTRDTEVGIISLGNHDLSKSWETYKAKFSRDHPIRTMEFSHVLQEINDYAGSILEN